MRQLHRFLYMVKIKRLAMDIKRTCNHDYVLSGICLNCLKGIP